ncbi:MAG: CDP-alcohol phosphatidyltransferase family protein [Candidatus Aminicenantes bacterium]|nr:CDP-alcohol phosphatidyltransferase family protein [Candidatus Aminicenantes bacterium]
MRNFFIALFSPLAPRLRRVHPNVLTLFSLLAGILAGISFALTGLAPLFFLVGGGFVALSGMGDSLDGIVARAHGRTSRTGDFLDHFADRLVDVAILAGLAFSRGAHAALGFILIVLALLHSYLGTQIEATLGRRSYAGTGKAELFVAFIAFTIPAYFLSAWYLRVGQHRLAFADLFMLALVLGTAISLVQRFRRGLQACMRADGGDR